MIGFMSAIFMKAKAMSMDVSGKFIVDHFLRINVHHIQSFRVIEVVDKQEMIMEVFFQGRISPMMLSLQADDLSSWVKT